MIVAATTEMCTLSLHDALPISEAAALRWENVSADAISVKAAYVAGDHKGTKTGRTRTVVMLPQLQHTLRLWAMAYGNITTDRKSTRLNSSHVAISYAVFCALKK